MKTKQYDPDFIGDNYRCVRNIENYYRTRGEPVPIIQIRGNTRLGYNFRSNLSFDCKTLSRKDHEKSPR